MGRAHCAAVVAHIQAMVLQALLTVLAQAARPARTDGDARAGRHVRHAGPDARDGAGDFVAEHHRFRDADRAEAAMVEVVKIGAADTAGANPHQQLVGFRFGRGHFLDAQIERCVNNECMHGRCLYRGMRGQCAVNAESARQR